MLQFEHFPRTCMGQHGQVRVDSKEEIEQIIERDNGKFHLYITHNAFPGKWTYFKDEPEVINVHQMFHDFDHKTKMENSLHEARQVAEWHVENDLEFTSAFSAGKGFHLYTQFTPAVYSLTDEIAITTEKKLTLRDYYKAIFLTLKRDLKLRTIDPQCSEPKRICRIWNTVNIRSGLYCIPLSEDQLFSLDINEIKELAKDPQPIPKIKTRNKMKFHEFIDEYEINPALNKVSFAGVESIRLAEWKYDNDPKRESWFQRYMPHGYPCIKQDMQHTSNPTHTARFASAVWWKQMADNAPIITNEQGEKMKVAPTPKFVDDFYRREKYDDVLNHKEREDNINSIFRNDYKMPKCTTLYEAGICLGEQCEKFHRFLGDVK